MDDGREHERRKGEGKQSVEGRWRRLVDWLKNDHGMDASPSGLRVECRASSGAGNGLFASYPCSASSTLFTIPASALINTKTLSSLYATKNGTSLTANQMITLHLLLHRPNGEDDSLDPRFGPFISTMPREFDSHPLTWTVHCQLDPAKQGLYHALYGMLSPSVTASLQRASVRFWEDWKAVCQYMIAKPNVIARSSPADASSLQFTEDNCATAQEYLWAWLNVNTRCIYYSLDPNPSAPCNVTLCPILDLANHAPSHAHIVPVIPSATSPPAPGSKHLRSAKLGGDYRFLASDSTPVHKGDELFLRYGGHSNQKLFVEYGFINMWTEGECRSGSFAGEIDVQDVVEAMFQARGDVGQWMEEVLMQEGYWGDWTLHSSPAPAHPSYRLITALRLYHTFPESSHTLPPDEDAHLQSWRRVLTGENDFVSEANEVAWGNTLLDLCGRISRRAREGMTLTDPSYVKEGALQPWLGWMLDNIRLLWQEEMEVADAVAASIRSGVDF